jgi:tRNA uridine 5-carbamoylmethylation protein Kti12
MPTIYIITGPPGSGKSSLCAELIRRFERGAVVPIDDIRQWVKSGLADAVPWTDETENQFQVAEHIAMDTAVRYVEAGFTVCLDHCRNLPRWNQLIETHLASQKVIRVCLLPRLEINQRRNRERKNKDFPPEILTETIDFTHQQFTSTSHHRWLVLDNSQLDVVQTVERILSHPSS